MIAVDYGGPHNRKAGAAARKKARQNRRSRRRVCRRLWQLVRRWSV